MLVEDKIIISDDGSNTIRSSRFNECYHSKNGAFEEAWHIYIKCGVEYLWQTLGLSGTIQPGGVPNRLAVYDIGFGTGLNGLVSIVWQELLKRSGECYPAIEFRSIEKYPVAYDVAIMMNYPSAVAKYVADEWNGIISEKEIFGWFSQMHGSEWERRVAVSDDFSIEKHCDDLLEVESSWFRNGISNSGEKLLSVVMYDTFSPDVQPELWSKEIFGRIFEESAEGSILTTYSSKGTVKQALRESGFKLSRLAGPKGKRHILRAVV